jgi:intracellular septation protein A
MEKLSPNSTNTNSSLIKVVLNKDFIISALIPIIIFVAFDKAKLTLIGIILSALWSIAVIVSGFIKERKINALAAFAGTFAVIGLVGTIISKNEKFYFIAPIIQDALLALVFFGSLLFNRSLVQVIAEQTYIKNIPDKIRNNPRYQSAWKILTIAWGTLNVVQAIIRALLLNHMSMSSYFAVNTTISNISDALLIIVCIMFPKWYLLRKTNTSNAN